MRIPQRAGATTQSGCKTFQFLFKKCLKVLLPTLIIEVMRASQQQLFKSWHDPGHANKFSDGSDIALTRSSFNSSITLMTSLPDHNYVILLEVGSKLLAKHLDNVQKISTICIPQRAGVMTPSGKLDIPLFVYDVYSRLYAEGNYWRNVSVTAAIQILTWSLTCY